ncbi:MAG TPA: hypothetical protein VGL17_12970 [Gemmatimonadaceae bacterium]
MQQKPQRPFVPHRTPKSSTGIASSSEFRLARPFVPEAERAQSVAGMSAAAVEAAPIESLEPTLRGIEEFAQEDEFELPPIEHFTDPLPAVESFAPGNGSAMVEGVDAMDYTSVGTSPPVPGSAGWVEEDWQHFDWRAAAALGDAPDAEATNDWASTDWDAAAPLPREHRPSAAQAIANALDNIARRIRDGDLAPAAPGELGDPTAIAAKLAALLGVRS